MSFKAFAQPILSFWVRGRAVIACIPGCPLGGLWVDSGWPLGGPWVASGLAGTLLLSGHYPGTIRAIGWMFVDPTRCLGKRAESEKLSTSPSTSNKFNNVNAFLLHPQIDNLSMKTNGK